MAVESGEQIIARKKPQVARIVEEEESKIEVDEFQGSSNKELLTKLDDRLYCDKCKKYLKDKFTMKEHRR